MSYPERELKPELAKQRHRSLWQAIFLPIMFILAIPSSFADQHLTLKLGSKNAFPYLSDLITQILEADGYEVSVVEISGIPTTRLEVMLEQGELSALMLGKTNSRSERFLMVEVDMTNNLMNQRILFIPPGQQSLYNNVQTLDDFRALGLTAAMGSAWHDCQIWEENNLPVFGITGDWRRLFDMLAYGNRGIDYLPRGAIEIAEEWQQYPKLQVEQSLALSYKDDHVLYVSPKEKALYHALNRLLPQASQSGLIQALVQKHHQEIFEPPVNLLERRVIPLNQTGAKRVNLKTM